MAAARDSAVDEETPLLQSNEGNSLATPLPWFQLSIVLLLQLTEPITSNVIHPFAPQLVRDSGVTAGNETQVGYYVGILHSVFFLAEAVTVLQWSRMSDSFGRKPIILCGLFGLSITMYVFGITTTFWGLVLSRGLMGALNGNISVIKSIVAELTDSTNISQAYAYMPLAWSTGIAVGPLIGGLLSHPVDRFPAILGDNAFLKAHPYFLPCAVPASLTALIWIITFQFLKETNPCPKSFTLFPWRKSELDRIPNNVKEQDTARMKDPLPLTSLLVYDVVVTSGNYAVVGFIDISFRIVLPVFLSTPISLGGLGLPTPTIGKILFSIGCLNAMQLFYFARLTNRWGTKNIFLAGVMSTLPAIALFPVINILARHSGCSFLVWLALGLQITFFSFLNLSYGTVFIFITAASPDPSVVGATNGLSQVTVSFMRGVGPFITNSLFSLSIEKGYLGGYLVYFALLLFAIVSIYIGSLLPNRLVSDKEFNKI